MKNLRNAMNACPAAFDDENAEKYSIFTMPSEWSGQLYTARRRSGYYYDGAAGRGPARNFINSVVRQARRAGVHCNLIKA